MANKKNTNSSKSKKKSVRNNKMNIARSKVGDSIIKKGEAKVTNSFSWPEELTYNPWAEADSNQNSSNQNSLREENLFRNIKRYDEERRWMLHGKPIDDIRFKYEWKSEYNNEYNLNKNANVKYALEELKAGVNRAKKFHSLRGVAQGTLADIKEDAYIFDDIKQNLETFIDISSSEREKDYNELANFLTDLNPDKKLSNDFTKFLIARKNSEEQLLNKVEDVIDAVELKNEENIPLKKIQSNMLKHDKARSMKPLINSSDELYKHDITDFIKNGFITLEKQESKDIVKKDEKPKSLREFNKEIRPLKMTISDVKAELEYMIPMLESKAFDNNYSDFLNNAYYIQRNCENPIKEGERNLINNFVELKKNVIKRIQTDKDDEKTIFEAYPEQVTRLYEANTVGQWRLAKHRYPKQNNDTKRNIEKMRYNARGEKIDIARNVHHN